ncbi:hypothetical protein [Novosphingobium resinovorum]|uniref:hypothetical protein n=1 Tax=Novosphingobium resinovorum TaxID=158500 RepID=UPI002ED502FD|nr:hypothetical protein [Novosphingobium resinovorum]
MPDPVEPAGEPLFARVEALLERMSQAWREGDFAFLRALWDETDHPVYLAEEADGFARGAEALGAYFAATEAMLPEVRGEYRLEAVTPLGGDLHIASFVNEWAAREAAGEPMVAGICRGIMVLEARGARLIPRAYIEAPKAPLLYMRDLYRMAARERGLH